MKIWRDPIREMQREAARRLPKPSGLIVPGWFWQEWMLVLGATVALSATVLALYVLVK